MHRHTRTGRKFPSSSTSNVVSAEARVAQMLHFVPSALVTTWVGSKGRSSARPSAFHRQSICFPARSGEKTPAGPSSVPTAPLEGTARCEPGSGAQHRPVGLLLPSGAVGEVNHTTWAHTHVREQDNARGRAPNGRLQPCWAQGIQTIKKKKRIKPLQCLCFKTQNNNNKKTSQVNYTRAERNL